jgi:hypothetical protein
LKHLGREARVVNMQASSWSGSLQRGCLLSFVCSFVFIATTDIW